MDLALFGTHDEQVFAGAVKVEAATTSQAGQTCLLLRNSAAGVHQLQHHHHLHLELVLGQDPVGHPAIGRNGVEVQVLGQVLLLPVHLPHRIRVLAALDVTHEDVLVLLLANVKHLHAAVVAPDSKQRAVLRMDSHAHAPRLRGERAFWVACVLQTVHSNQPRALLHEVVVAVGHHEHVRKLGVPRQRRDLLAACAGIGKAPQRQQGPITGTELVGRVFPVLEVGVDFILRVLVHHALHDLQAVAHLLAVDDVVVFLGGGGHQT